MSKPTAVTRRALLGGVAATAATVPLAGCNLARGGSGSNNAGGGGGGITLNVWGGVPNETGPDELCKAFMAEHPDIKVTYTRYVNDDDGNLKLDTSLTGGVPIDMYFSYSPPKVADRAKAGLALDLTDKISTEPDFAQFAIDADPAGNFAFDGVQYAIPAAHAPQNVYINKTMLDDAGIKLNDTWSIDEFVDVATKLTKDGVFGCLQHPVQARPAIGPDYFYADGGSRSNFDDPWFSKEMELALQLQKSKVTMDQKTVIAEDLKTFSQNAFIGERTAMLINSGHITRSISDKTEYPHDFITYCMPIPIPEGVDDHWTTGGVGDLIAISPKSEHQDEAWELAKFWVRNAAKYMTKGGRLPALAGETSEEQIVADLLGPDRDTLYDVESWQRMLFSPDLRLPVDTIFVAGTEIATNLEKTTDELLLGDRDLNSWVDQMVKTSDAAIKKSS